MTPAPDTADSSYGEDVSPHRILVRAATRADLPSVLELRLALLQEHGDSLIYRRLRPDARERARELFGNQLASPYEVTLLAEMEGHVVGILRCVESKGMPLLYPSRYAYISSVYVVPHARRSGVVRALLAQATSWCEARGLTEMRLHNAAENAAANATWHALGFEIVEHLRVRQLR